MLTPSLISFLGQTLGLNGLQCSLPLSQPTCLAEFKQIKSIRCLPLEEGQAVLQLGIEGAPQSLSIKTSSLAEAENMADLIDGYCRLQGEHQGSLIINARKGRFLFGDRIA